MTDLIDPDKLKQIVEAALMAAHEPLSVDRISKLFSHGELDSEAGRAQIRETLAVLEEEAAGRGYELKRVATGYRYQVRQELAAWVSRLWEEKPPRYSRALLETLALIAYRQPVTRGDIEQVRGVAVSQNIMRTLQERNWIRVVGQREVPGKPSLYGTTREFLDYFDLKSLDQLPPLAEIRSLLEPVVSDETEPADSQSRDGGASHTPSDTESSQHAPSEERAEAGEADRAGSKEVAEADEDAEDGEDVAGHGEDVAEDGEDVAEDGEDVAEDGEHVASGEEDARRAPSAEVVRLPTSPRR